MLQIIGIWAAFILLAFVIKEAITTPSYKSRTRGSH